MRFRLTTQADQDIACVIKRGETFEYAKRNFTEESADKKAKERI
jgi:hypothetical protein